LDKDDESWVSKKQDNDTTNILISKEMDLKIKLDSSKMKVYNEMNRWKSWFNPESSKVMEGLISLRHSILEVTDFAFFLEDNSGDRIKFHEAYNHPEPGARVKW
jgi:hypothetical protein